MISLTQVEHLPLIPQLAIGTTPVVIMAKGLFNRTMTVETNTKPVPLHLIRLV